MHLNKGKDMLEKFIKIVEEVLKTKIEWENEKNIKLDKLDIHSIEFIEIIVDTEIEFDIRFPDCYLLASYFEDLESIYKVLVELINN